MSTDYLSVDKHYVEYRHAVISLSLKKEGSFKKKRKNEVLTRATTWMNPEDITLSSKPNTKGPTLLDSTFVR